jgi:hypothetical protein
MVPFCRGPIVGIFATVAEFETSFAFMGITAAVCAKILVLVFIYLLHVRTNTSLGAIMQGVFPAGGLPETE